jgi:hypothetical protein
LTQSPMMPRSLVSRATSTISGGTSTPLEQHSYRVQVGVAEGQAERHARGQHAIELGREPRTAVERRAPGHRFADGRTRSILPAPGPPACRSGSAPGPVNPVRRR